MNLIQAMQNVTSGVFIQSWSKANSQMTRKERQLKAKKVREKQIDDAILSTGIHHRESLFKKWGW